MKFAKMTLTAAVLLLFMLLPAVAHAESPLTSTGFHKAYSEIDTVKLALQEGIMTYEIGTYLASPDIPVHVKAAVINALGWDHNGKNNAEYYSYLMYRKPIKYLNMEDMSADQLFCVGYLLAMDNYYDPSRALPFLEKAAAKMKHNYTISVVHALTKAQQSVNSGKQGDAWKLIEDIRNNKELELDLRPEARELIYSFMSKYASFSNGIVVSPTLITVDADKTVTAAISGGTPPYKLASGCQEADVRISGTTVTVTGIRAASTQVTISDKDERTVTLPITVNKPEAIRRAEKGIVLFMDSPYAYVNGQFKHIDPSNTSIAPVIRNDYVLVPVRFIAESLNAVVSWDDATATATLTTEKDIIKIPLRSSTISVNGVEVALQVPVESVDGKAFIPLRALVEALGKKVFFERRLIVISDSDGIIDRSKEQHIVDELIALFDINTKGNSRGNISNYGLAAKQGSYIYFSNSSDSNRLYRMKFDGTGVVRLSEDSSAFINVAGDWIYYSNLSDNDKLYRMRTDGTGKTLIAEDKAGSVNVVGDWIYYQNYSDGNKIYRVKADGSQKGIVSNDNAEFVNVSGEYIYYCNTSDQYKLYKIKLDGSDRVCLNDDSSWFVNVSGDLIYYCNSSDGDKLYSIKTDGSERTRLNHDRSWNLNVSGDYIYYNNYSYVNSLYRVKTDGSERTRLSSEKAKNINTAGDFIIFESAADDGKVYLYRINLDGTGLTKF